MPTDEDPENRKQIGGIFFHNRKGLGQFQISNICNLNIIMSGPNKDWIV